MTGRREGPKLMSQKFISSPIHVTLQENCAHRKYVVGVDVWKTWTLRPTHSVIRTVSISPPFPWHTQSDLNLSHNSEWPFIAWPKTPAALLVSQVEKLRLTNKEKGRDKAAAKIRKRLGRESYFVSSSVSSAKLPHPYCNKPYKQVFCQAGFQVSGMCLLKKQCDMSHLW